MSEGDLAGISSTNFEISDEQTDEILEHKAGASSPGRDFEAYP
jgi:hypothetical protein